jgi:ketosteroid isomerase-like protein
VNTGEERNRRTYMRFAAAWGARDVHAIADLVTDDIIYSASVGPEPGESYHGKAAVLEGIRAMMAHDDAVATEVVSLNIFGNLAFPQWRYTLPDGSVVKGIDAIVFRNGRIARKDGYRKVRNG